MKIKKRINDFTDFATDFTKKWNSETPVEIKLPDHENEEARREENMEEMDREQKEREENGEMKTESKKTLKHLLTFKR